MILAVTGALNAGEKSPLVYRGEYEDIIPKAAKTGYDAMELHIHDSEKLDRQELKELFNQSNIILSSIGTGSAYGIDGISLTSEDKNIRNKAIKRIKEHIITAMDYNAVVIIGLIKGKVSEAESKKSYLKHLDESLNECLKTAAENNVTLVIEILNRYESDIFNTMEEGLEYIKKFDSNYIKLHIDTYHMNIEEASCKESIIRCNGYIGHVHIADSDRWYAGHGHYDFRETIQALSDIGYNKALSVESFMFPESQISATRSLEILKEITNSLV